MRSTFSYLPLSCLLSVSLTFLPTAANADVKMPAIFTSHMVLQQGQANRVWGWADAGEDVVVSLLDQVHRTTAGADGRWQVSLRQLAVGGPHTMTVKGKNTLTIEDILVGEVWICSGQSNMQWSVKQSNDFDLEIATANFPKIRFISVPQVGTQEPQNNFVGSWSVCSPETVGEFSAVGYSFGRRLHIALGVPIGLIDNAWGGSACEAWIRRDVLEKDPQYQSLIDRWKADEAFDPVKALEEFQTKHAAWKLAAEAAKAEGKPVPAEPKAPRSANDLKKLMSGNSRPGNIYNGVLKPTIGYGIKGAIWYQGESNASRAYQYRELFPLMIKHWRDEWNQGDFPFYWVQLADYLAETSSPGESAWAELREAQTMTMSKLPKTGQAVIIDIGEGKDIHPRNKYDVANRLARWALAKDYGISISCQSPTYESHAVDGNKVVVKFSNVGAGLRPFDVNEVRGFAVAGEDKKWAWAKAKLAGKDSIELVADEVAKPVAVRYGWANNPVVNLFSMENLPVTPFRTDDWPGETINNNK